MHFKNIPVTLLMIALSAVGVAVAQTQVAPAIQTPVLPPSKISADNPLGVSSDHITIWVADADKESAWYQSMFGFKEIQHRSQPENEYRQLRIPGVYRIDLTWWKGSTRHVSAKDAAMEQGYRHIVFKTQDLKAALEQLTSKHANVRAQKDQNGELENVFVLDPEGNEIELQQF